eukprot:TRINITY_DN20572_c0_g1_i1.p1 TRINITY_DN20572_c0_g1~~TRINITY_DN20572_c0_g1_i1.p1  ORF type:complete len:982 (+),score=206.56 TRINITY_DN20572_c0_g1_i1:57-3002(+)
MNLDLKERYNHWVQDCKNLEEYARETQREYPYRGRVTQLICEKHLFGADIADQWVFDDVLEWNGEEVQEAAQALEEIKEVVLANNCRFYGVGPGEAYEAWKCQLYMGDLELGKVKACIVPGIAKDSGVFMKARVLVSPEAEEATGHAENGELYAAWGRKLREMELEMAARKAEAQQLVGYYYGYLTHLLFRTIHEKCVSALGEKKGAPADPTAAIYKKVASQLEETEEFQVLSREMEAEVKDAVFEGVRIVHRAYSLDEPPTFYWRPHVFRTDYEEANQEVFNWPAKGRVVLKVILPAYLVKGKRHANAFVYVGERAAETEKAEAAREGEQQGEGVEMDVSEVEVQELAVDTPKYVSDLIKEGRLDYAHQIATGILRNQKTDALYCALGVIHYLKAELKMAYNYLSESNRINPSVFTLAHLVFVSLESKSEGETTGMLKDDMRLYEMIHHPIVSALKVKLLGAPLDEILLNGEDSSDDFYYWRSLAYMWSGDVERAIEENEKIKNPDFMHLFWRGRILIASIKPEQSKLDKLNKAIDCFKESTNKCPEFLLAMNYLLTSYATKIFELQDSEKRNSFIEEISPLLEDNWRSKYAFGIQRVRGDIYLFTSNIERSIQIYDSQCVNYSKELPTFKEEYLVFKRKKATALMLLGRLQEAIQYLDAIYTETNEIKFLKKIGICWMNLNVYSVAYRVLSHPLLENDLMSSVYKAICAKAIGNPEAVELLKSCLDQTEDEFIRLLCLFELERYEEAISLVDPFHKKFSFKTNHKRLKYYITVGECFRQVGKYKEALSCFGFASDYKIPLYYIYVQFMKGVCNLNQIHKAIPFFEKVLKSSSLNYNDELCKGISSRYLGNINSAEEILRHLVEKSNSEVVLNAMAQLNLGITKIYLYQQEEAEGIFSKISLNDALPEGLVVTAKLFYGVCCCVKRQSWLPSKIKFIPIEAKFILEVEFKALVQAKKKDSQESLLEKAVAADLLVYLQQH